MANGKITIDVELNDDGVLSGLKNIESMAGGPQGKKNGGLIGNMFGGIKNMVGAGLALKGVQVAWNSLKSGVTDGISRYDTMQRFPKMMEQIGFTSGEADQAIQSLTNGIQGLPTTLDSVTSTAQQIALMSGDLTGAVDTTLALNNAFLASGSSSADAGRGMMQFQQMMARGEPDLQSWRTLMETMPVALKMLGKELGYSGENLYELYDAMQAGELTFEDFTNGLIALNEKQGGLADMAKENSKGIATSWQNVSTAIGRGWAKILEATDRGLARFGMENLATQIDKLQGVVNKGFSAVVSGIDWVTRTAVKLGPVFSEIGKQVGNFLRPLAESASKFFKPVMDGFGEIGSAVTNFGYRMKGVLRAIGEGNWQSAWNIFRDASLQVFEKVGTAFGNMFTGMRDNFNSIDWQGLGTTVLNGIQSGIRTARGLIMTVGQTVKGFIFDSLGAQSWADVGQVVMSGIISGVESAVGLMMFVGGAIKGMIFTALGAESWGDVATTILNGITNSIQAGIGLVLGAGRAIKDWIFEQTGAENWGEVAQSVMQGIGYAWNGAVAFLGEVGSTIKGWVFERTGAESWGEVAGMVFTGIGSAWSIVRANLGQVGSTIKQYVFERTGAETWGEVAQSVFSGIGNAWGTARSSLGEVGSLIKSWVFEQTGSQTWGEVATTVFSGIGQAWSTARNMLGEVGSIVKGWIFEKFGAENWSDVGTSLLTSVGTALKAINWENVGEVVGTALGTALLAIGGLVGTIATSIDWSSLKNGIEKGIGNALGKIDFKALAKEFFTSFEAGFDPTLFEWGPIGKTIMEALGFEIEESSPAEPDVDVEPEIREVTVQNPEKVDEEIKRGVGGREGGPGGRGGGVVVNKDIVARIMEIAMEGKNTEDLRRMINDEFGPGTYESVITPEILIEILKLSGADESVLRMMIDEEFGEGTYDTTVKVEVEAEPEMGKSEPLDPLIQGHIAGQVIEPVEKEVIVNPKITIGHGGSDSLAGEGAQPGGLAGASMFAGMIQQIQQGMVSVQEAVNQSMKSIGESISMQAQQWSTSLSTAFIGMGLAVSMGMLAMTLAVTLGFTTMSLAVTTGMLGMTLAVSTGMLGMTLAVSMGMLGMSLAVTTGMLGMTLAISMGMLSMTLAISMGMLGMSLAVTTGMLAMTLAVTTGMLGMTLAVTLGMTAMSLAVTTAMVAMTLAITLAMVAIELSVTNAMTEMSTATTEAMTEISTATTEAMTEVSTATTESMTEMSTATTESMTEMSTATTEAMTEMSTATSEAMTEMSTATTEAMTEMSTAIDELAQTVADATSQMAESFSQVAQSISDSMQSAVQAVQDAGSQIIDALDALGGQAQASGARIGVGLANGIYSSAGSAISAAQYLADSVNNILNSVFRFGSPSKVTTQYGEWIGQGLSRGMEHTYGLVNKVSNKLGGYALPTIDPNRAIGLSGYGSSGSTNYQSEVNIHIDKFINNRKEDLPQLVEELRYYENIKLQGGL